MSSFTHPPSIGIPTNTITPTKSPHTPLSHLHHAATAATTTLFGTPTSRQTPTRVSTNTTSRLSPPLSKTPTLSNRRPLSTLTPNKTSLGLPLRIRTPSKPSPSPSPPSRGKTKSGPSAALCKTTKATERGRYEGVVRKGKKGEGRWGKGKKIIKDTASVASSVSATDHLNVSNISAITDASFTHHRSTTALSSADSSLVSVVLPTMGTVGLLHSTVGDEHYLMNGEALDESTVNSVNSLEEVGWLGGRGGRSGSDPEERCQDPIARELGESEEEEEEEEENQQYWADEKKGEDEDEEGGRVRMLSVDSYRVSPTMGLDDAVSGGGGDCSQEEERAGPATPVSKIQESHCAVVRPTPKKL